MGGWAGVDSGFASSEKYPCTCLTRESRSFTIEMWARGGALKWRSNSTSHQGSDDQMLQENAPEMSRTETLVSYATQQMNSGETIMSGMEAEQSGTEAGQSRTERAVFIRHKHEIC